MIHVLRLIAGFLILCIPVLFCALIQWFVRRFPQSADVIGNALIVLIIVLLGVVMAYFFGTFFI